MKRDVVEFVYACLTCQKSNIEHQKPSGLMQTLSIPDCDSISIDFVAELPKTAKGNDSIWVIVDILTKSTHFLLMKINHSLHNLAELYIEEVMRLHGTPSSIMPDRDPSFTSRFWRVCKLHLELS